LLQILNEFLRNDVLKDIKEHSELMDMLDIWDEKLAVQGALVARERIAYIKNFSKYCSEFYTGISK